jgi:hypothetical protein
VTTRSLLLARRVNAAAVIVLVVGFASVLAIFFSRQDTNPAIVGYEIVNGVSYPVKPEEDRQYEYQVERLGGKMGWAMVQFNDWFSGLWQGRTLAYTIAVLTLGSAGVLRFVAREITWDGSHAPTEDETPPADGR